MSNLLKFFALFLFIDASIGGVNGNGGKEKISDAAVV